MCYEFDIDVDWFAEDDVAEAAGKYSIIDVNESDLDFTVFYLFFSNIIILD